MTCCTVGVTHMTELYREGIRTTDQQNENIRYLRHSYVLGSINTLCILNTFGDILQHDEEFIVCITVHDISSIKGKSYNLRKVE